MRAWSVLNESDCHIFVFGHALGVDGVGQLNELLAGILVRPVTAGARSQRSDGTCPARCGCAVPAAGW
jgi:hypothetical protein